MPKNKPKPNAFMLYVFDRKRDMEKEGAKFVNLADAVDKIGPEWEHLSKEEKAKYDEKAKARKAAAQEEDQVRRIQIAGSGWTTEQERAGPSVLQGFPG